MLRELVTRPISALAALLDLPRTLERSVREAGELMEISRQQLEMMRRQADQALEQAERMNDLLGRVVKLTEPLEKAQRGGEIVGGRLKRAILGNEARREAESAVEDAELAAEHAEAAAEQAETAAGGVKSATADADEAADEADEAAEEADEAAEEADSRA